MEHSSRLLLILLLSTVCCLLSTSAWSQEEQGLSPDQETGKKIYEKRCIYCHGPQGRGDGAAAAFLKPPPTNFARGRFKFRTTPEKTLPRDEDLLRVVSEGLPGTGMPGWKDVLSEEQRRQVVQYIKTLNRRFEDYTPEPLPTVKPIPSSRESIEKGEELYFKLECNRCHGDEGRADGKNAAELRSWPRNLTKRWLFREGRSSTDIYFRITYGADPMPSFIEDTTEEERWHLVNFVLTLSPEKEPPVRILLKTKLLEGELPLDPDDPQWQKVESSDYPLIGQVIEEPRLFTPTVTSIHMRALYNEKEIALRFTWDDPTQSQRDPEKGTYPDSVAVQFPVAVSPEQEQPYFLRGGDRSPVYLWQWSNDQSVKESNSFGLKQEQVQPVEALQLQGQGIYDHGQYRVIFKRSLTTNDREGDLQFVTGRLIPIAFSVWDGENGEGGEKMAISHWYYLVLEPPPSSERFVYPSILTAVVVGLEWWIIRKARGRQIR